jgi:hypothetical protein
MARKLHSNRREPDLADTNPPRPLRPPLHGAKCHGCLLIAETSCEARNLFLDRALLADTMAGRRVPSSTSSPAVTPRLPAREDGSGSRNLAV